MKRNIVVAITGASGVTYAMRLLEVLLAAGCDCPSHHQRRRPEHPQARSST